MTRRPEGELRSPFGANSVRSPAAEAAPRSCPPAPTAPLASPARRASPVQQRQEQQRQQRPQQQEPATPRSGSQPKQMHLNLGQVSCEACGAIQV